MPKERNKADSYREKAYEGDTKAMNNLGVCYECGTEWLYLWTDCTCNWEYYPKHGYELIGEGIAPEFSTDAAEYTYRMYRKRIV